MSKRGVAALVLLVIVTASALAIAVAPARQPLPADADHVASTTSVIEPAIYYKYAMFSADGEPLLTNQYSVALLISQSNPGYILHNDSEYGWNVLEPESTSPFGPVFDTLVRNAANDGLHVLNTPVISANDTITGADGQKVSIPREFGPFRLTETVPLEAFRGRFPNATEGEIVQLNARFRVRVNEIAHHSVTYAFVVEDGERHPYPELGSAAELATNVDEANGTFSERIEIPLGSVFHRKNDRMALISNGTYLVESLTEAEIGLAKLKAPPSYYTMQDVFFVVEIGRPRDV